MAVLKDSYTIYTTLPESDLYLDRIEYSYLYKPIFIFKCLNNDCNNYIAQPLSPRLTDDL